MFLALQYITRAGRKREQQITQIMNGKMCAVTKEAWSERICSISFLARSGNQLEPGFA